MQKAVFSKVNESALTAVNGSKKTLVVKGLLNSTDSKYHRL